MVTLPLRQGPTLTQLRPPACAHADDYRNRAAREKTRSLWRTIRNGLCVSLCALAIALPAYSQDGEMAVERRGGSSHVKELQAQAAAAPPQTDDRQELSVFLHQRGRAKQQLGDYQGAAADLRLALASNPASTLQEWGDRWRIQTDLSSVLVAIGDLFAVIDHAKSLVSEASGSAFNYHNANINLVYAYSALGNFPEAERALAEANGTFPRMQRARNWSRESANALSLNNRANAVFFNRQGNHAEAERLFKLALVNAQTNVELQYKIQAQGHQFIRVAVSNLADTKIALADVLATRGKFAEAEFDARAGLEDRLAMFAFDTAPVSRALSVLGWIRFQQGDVEAAQKYYRHALAALQNSGVLPHSTLLAARRAELANVLLVQSRWLDARRIFEERGNALRLDPEQFKRIGSAHVGWALALVKTGQTRRAAEMIERMIASQLKQTVPNRYYLAQLRGVLGMVQTALGNTAVALQAYQQAIPAIIRRDQGDAGAEDSGYWRVFWRQTILEGYIELLGNLHDAGTPPANMDLADESFKLADLARGSGVQEAISASAARAQLPHADLAEMARKDQDGLNRIVALNQILGRLAAAPEGERLNKIIGDMRADIERLQQQHTELRAEITRRFPEYVELIDPKSPGLADAARALAADEALVAIYVGDAQAYVWTIGPTGRRSFRAVPVARTEIEADVVKLRGAVEFGEGGMSQLPVFDLARAHRLYKLLLEPDEALWKEARILNVIPHGALAQLPFSLLTTAPAAHQPGAGAQAGYREAAWLVRKVAIAQLPSVNALTALRRAPEPREGRQPFVGFGDPLFSADGGAATRRGAVRNLSIKKTADATEVRINELSHTVGRPQNKPPSAVLPSRATAFSLLSALPDTADELTEIATALKAHSNRDLYLGRQASERNVKQTKLEDRRVVAFATHGLAPGEVTGLDQPALVLSNPTLTGDNDDDGFLTMEEVLGLRLDADWVVLSACNTASADGKGSEAVSGLGRAFFYAGARSLLVSNWSVETTSARLVTTELFRRQAENPALTRAEALRQSMLSLMEMSATGRMTFSYAHPAFWAPFSLVGDSGAARVIAQQR